MEQWLCPVHWKLDDTVMIEMEEDTSEWETLCAHDCKKRASFPKPSTDSMQHLRKFQRRFTEREQPIFKFVRTTEDSG